MTAHATRDRVAVAGEDGWRDDGRPCRENFTWYTTNASDAHWRGKSTSPVKYQYKAFAG